MRKIHVRKEWSQQRPAVVLRRGDVFRARGGPVFVCEDSTEVDMGSAGEYRFLRACRQGADVWLEGVPLGGGAVEHVYVGRRKWSRAVPGLHHRPHRVSKRRQASVDKASGVTRRRAKRAARQASAPVCTNSNLEVAGG